MNYEAWINRVENRSDITSRLTHLTRSNGTMTAMDVLNKILEERVIIGSTRESGYIVGNDTAVCFQEVPLIAIAENVLYGKQSEACKARYEGYGVRINKQHAYARGARNVIYGSTKEMKSILPQSEWWRIVNHDLTDFNHVIDWTHEREWRFKGCYALDITNIEVIVPDSDGYRKFMNYWLGKDPNLLRQINGIICLDSCIR